MNRYYKIISSVVFVILILSIITISAEATPPRMADEQTAGTVIFDVFYVFLVMFIFIFSFLFIPVTFLLIIIESIAFFSIVKNLNNNKPRVVWIPCLRGYEIGKAVDSVSGKNYSSMFY